MNLKARVFLSDGIWIIFLPNDPKFYVSDSLALACTFAVSAIGTMRLFAGVREVIQSKTAAAQLEALPLDRSTTIH